MELLSGSRLWKARIKIVQERWWVSMYLWIRIELGCNIWYFVVLSRNVHYHQGCPLSIFCPSASARRRWPAQRDQSKNFWDQWTVDKLSYWIPTLERFISGTSSSSETHSRRTPAISKTLIEMVPCLKRITMSGGNSQFHTMNFLVS